MTKQRVIFVHGMSDHLLADEGAEATFFIGLRNALIGRLKSLGAISHDAPEGNEIDGSISFGHAHYSDVGAAQEEAVMKVHNEASKTLFGIVDNTLAPIFNAARKQLVTAFSDVLVYRSVHWQEDIRRRLLDQINPHIHSGEQITLIAHSLGAAVTFDTVYYNINSAEWKAAGFKPANLFVMGSPIALFTMEPDPEPVPALESPGLESMTTVAPWQSLLRQVVDQVADSIEQELSIHPVAGGLDPRLDILAPGGVLYNFLDAQDLIAYPIEAFFKGKVTYEVKDISVDNGLGPIGAHSKYWDNDEVAQTIAEHLAKALKATA